MTDLAHQLDKRKHMTVSLKIIGAVLVIYLLLSFTSPASDNIGVFVIPLAAVCFYAPLICLIACYKQAKRLKQSLSEEEQDSIKTWDLMMTGMPDLYKLTGGLGLLACVFFPPSIALFLMAPVWVVYGLAPF